MKVGFIINPIAGMGGRVGLKGTDGMSEEAERLGALPLSEEHSKIMLVELRRLMKDDYGTIAWLTCSGQMGANILTEHEFTFQSLYQAGEKTSSADTVDAAGKFLEAGAEIIVFAGGDGTARDICGVVKKKIPILGIPSGVKMHSGVFGVTPAKTAEVLAGFVRGGLKPAEAEIMDLDEDMYRRGEWSVRLYDSALTPFEPTLVQTSKIMIEETSDAEILEEIGEYVQELVKENPETLFILGPGSTTEAIGKMLGMEKTLLGIDAFTGGSQVGSDLNEGGLIKLLDKYNSVKLILSPIGSQGFVLGRGNLQLSPEIIARIGRDNFLIVATPAKLQRTPVLRFDTGDAKLDKTLAGRGWFQVTMGYRLSRLVKVEI